MDAFGSKRTWRWTFLIPALFFGAGCHTTQPIHDEFTMAPVHQVHATWSNKIAVTTDYGSNQGAELPGLAGRLYLMGPDLGHTVKANGRVVVDLFDAGHGKKPQLLGRWQISKENLARLGQKDLMGLGYTLFLPWPDYKPDYTRLQLQVSYLPDEGPAMLAPRYALNLSQDEFKSVASVVRPQPATAPEPARVTAVPGPATEQPARIGTVLVSTQDGQ